MLSINPDRRREAPVALSDKSVPRCHRNLPPRPCRSGSCLQVSTPSRRRPTSAPSRGSSEKPSRLLDDLTAAMEAEMTKAARSDEYFLGTMLFIEAERSAGRLPFSRQSRVLEVVDGLQRLTTLDHSLLSSATSKQKAAGPNQRAPAGRHRHRAGGNARPRLSLREPEEAFFQAYVRKPGATASARSERRSFVA